jgi:hypothetical protein
MRKVTTWTVSIAAALVALPTGAVQITYLANLDGASENPPNASPGTGTARVTIDDEALTMRVQAVFADLIGTTTASHIHCCTDAPGNAGVATTTPTFPGFPLGVTSGSYDRTFDLTFAGSFNSTFVNNNGGTVDSARAALLAGLAAGRAYLNIHSSFRPGGEIRGFMVRSVPEPGALVLLGLGLLAVAVTLRSRRRG